LHLASDGEVINELWLLNHSIRWLGSNGMSRPPLPMRVDSFGLFFLWLCDGVRLPTSYSNIFIIAERYSYLILIVIGSAILFNKEQPLLSQFATSYVIVFHYIFMGFV
jgi:hypothetical protein